MKKLYVIDYENAHWCGGQLNVCVWAHNPDDAIERAEEHMEDTQRELFADEYGESVSEDEEYSDDRAYIVNRVELLDREHDCWDFYCDPSQAEFYPVIGEPD